jgi:hypothetical protein
MEYYKIDRLTGLKVFYGTLTIPVLCVGSIFSLEGFKFPFAVCVLLLSVFAGSTVVGVTNTHTNSSLRLFFSFEVETSMVIYLILDKSHSSIGNCKKKV